MGTIRARFTDRTVRRVSASEPAKAIVGAEAHNDWRSDARLVQCKVLDKTQINIDGDKYLHDDFAFATRDELIPRVEAVTDASEIDKAGLNKPFARIRFDFAVTREVAGAPTTIVAREHAEAA